MCSSCWESYGSPKINNKKVRNCVNLINEVYKENLGGGGLHIVLDDYNISSGYIEDCLKDYCEVEVDKECAKYMLTMSLEEQVSAVSLYHGNWKIGE